ncbi:MAG TPA: hypothetical protein PLE69_00795 [bacterium]|nr:hypothetical protein [bacterium]
MRRTAKEMKKLRLKIIEMKKEGKSYEEIRRTTSASPNTIARILKGFTGRYCVMCGETNPDVLHEHHPDRKNRPDYTITLCANCHNEVHRGKSKKKNVPEQTSNINTQNQSPIHPQITPINSLQKTESTIPEVKPPITSEYIQPSNLNEVKNILFLMGGLAGIREGLLNSKRKPVEKLILIASGIFYLIKGIEAIKEKK